MKISIDMLDRAGRPVLRAAAVGIFILIGLAIAVAFWFWAVTGRPFPPLPGEAIILVMAAQIPQWIDQVTRHLQRNTELRLNNIPYGVNPHGGPDAP